ncbi:ATP-binding cassette domain-containing protein [Neptuniibacter sp. CAU 1671]|uniref:ABC transporter ATP-binding protein n=1 Tax=Neptuniibacter sp. CAU 1671 TaxID=3032593 RepID=UPI0023DC468A|nr:ATP-binding cassette domain-containing protein [Neptuniibacter sp. CAU 1671]MDF2180761.1 ATP-binding cassette domain-containing protein [Neptuniibacter sp. CAU 1671]
MISWSIPGRSFNDKPVLGEISLSLAPGESHCLIGPSGFGKTTLLNILADLDVDGVKANWKSGKPHIGYLFQQPRLLPWRTLRENLLLVKDDLPAVDEMLEAVNLQGYGDYYPSRISLGMARRAALARCLLMEPDLVLMDEPLVSLDTPTAAQMRRLIKRLVCDHPTRCLIYVTHDLEEALQMGDRISVLGGKPAQLVFSARSGELSREILEHKLQEQFNSVA